MQQRPKQLESDMQRGQEQAVESTAKKARRDKPISFTRKADHEQFDFNERVAGRLERPAVTTDEISKQPTDTMSLAKAKVALDCGKTNS